MARNVARWLLLATVLLGLHLIGPADATTLDAPSSFTAATTPYTANTRFCTVTASWEAPASANGIDHYVLYRNGTALATTSELSYQDASTVANSSYNYAVFAFDRSGNASNSSAVASVSTSSCTPGAAFRLGVMYTAAASTFSVWSPDSSSVALNLNGTVYPMVQLQNPPNGYTDVYSITVQGDLSGQLYNFQVNGATSCDPYAVMRTPGTCNDIVLDPDAVVLATGWSPRPTLVNRTDSIIYEAHVREFSNDPSSGVPAGDRGYFEGMTDLGTTVNGVPGAPDTALAHLVDMGVTHIQLMPVAEFASCNNKTANNTCFNWGYDPAAFNVPSAAYSQTPENYGNRILEFKQMVDNFHRQGIRVILDVVYNHTASKKVLGNITSRYYLSSDITATGNTLDALNPMVARLIQDSLEYWVKEFNVDGFRFDLLGAFPVAAVRQWGAYLNAAYPDRNLLLYGEPWAATSVSNAYFDLGNLGTVSDTHIGAFNGAYRGALKGSDDNGGGSTGFMFGQSTVDSAFGSFHPNYVWPGTSTDGYGPISLGVAASPLASLPATTSSKTYPAEITAAPEQTINYVSVHDNLCLADKINAWQSANGLFGQPLKDALIDYAFGLVLSSQGIPFFYEGDEFQRTKQGNANSYNTEYDLNWSSIANNQDAAATYAYVKALIALRKAHSSLHLSSWDAIRTNVLSQQLSKTLVVTRINASAVSNESWSSIVVAANSSDSPQPISLPSISGNWFASVYGQTLEPSGTTAAAVGGSNASPMVPARSISVFYH